MKVIKRLMALIMVAIMITTIAPLSLFAFAAEDVETSHEISSFADLKKIGVENDWDLSDDYTMTADILLSADSQLEAWLQDLDAQQEAGDYLENDPQYINEFADDFDFESFEGIFYEKDYVYTADETIIDQDTYDAAVLEGAEYYYLDETEAYVLVEAFNEEQLPYYTCAKEGDFIEAENVTVENYNDGSFYIIVYSPVTYSDLDDTDKEILIAYNEFTDEKDPTFAMINGEFTGTFDGANYTISGIEITSENESVALFYENSGVIKDLTLDETCTLSLDVEATFINAAGSFVAMNNEEGVLSGLTSNATLDVSVTLPQPLLLTIGVEIGGIVGYNEGSVADCAFGGDIAYYCGEDTFGEDSNLKTINNSMIYIGGLAGESATEVTGTYTGTISSDIIGGPKMAFNETVACDQVGANALYPFAELTDEQKTVGDKDAASAIEGEAVLGEVIDGYQLVTTTTEEGQVVYYIRQFVCAHELTEHEATTPNCTESGNTAYWSCEKCGRYFSDAEATTEIEEDSWVLAPQHNLPENPVDPENPATCTTGGSIAYWQCEDCGKYFSDAEGKNEIEENGWIVEADPTNHPNLPEEPVAEEVAATCKSQGNIAYWYCPDCEKYFSDAEGKNEIEENAWITEIDPNNHATLEATPEVAATCTAQGNTAYWYCPDCEKYFSDAEGKNGIEENAWITEIDPDNHATLKQVDEIPASCTTEGRKAYWECKDCGKKFSNKYGTKEITDESTLVIPATGHTLTKVKAKDATCTATGNTAYWKCKNCGKFFSDADGKTEIQKDSWIIKATGHTLTKVKAKDATCTAAGNTAYWKCKDCGKYFSDSKGKNEIAKNSWIIKATGHKGTKVKAKSPTTTATGNKVYYKCSDCGKLFTDKACTKSTTLAKVTIPVVKVKSSSGYKKITIGSKYYIDNIVPSSKSGVSVKTFKNNLAALDSSYSYVVRNADGKAVTSGIIATGYTVEIKGYSSTKTTIIVKGDLNKDGKITSADSVKLKNHLNGKKKITNKMLLKAADFNKDGKVTSADNVKIKKLISK